jgi:hypothetical protein
MLTLACSRATLLQAGNNVTKHLRQCPQRNEITKVRGNEKRRGVWFERNKEKLAALQPGTRSKFNAPLGIGTLVESRKVTGSFFEQVAGGCCHRVPGGCVEGGAWRGRGGGVEA